MVRAFFELRQSEFVAGAHPNKRKMKLARGGTGQIPVVTVLR